MDPAGPPGASTTAARVSEAVIGLPLSSASRSPGTVPMWQVCAPPPRPGDEPGRRPSDCRAHAPDENIRIEDLAAATRMMGRFVDALARLPEVPKVP